MESLIWCVTRSTQCFIGISVKINIVLQVCDMLTNQGSLLELKGDSSHCESGWIICHYACLSSEITGISDTLMRLR